MKRVGFIGAGNMGAALLRGFIDKGGVKSSNVVVYDKEAEKTIILEKELGVAVSSSVNEVVSASDAVFLAVKPQNMEEVLNDVSSDAEDRLFVSIAAGISTTYIEKHLSASAHIIRVMPNTPTLVGELAAAIAKGPRATDEDVSFVSSLLGTLGVVVEVDESLLDAVTGLSGSGPAYFYYMIQALADAGVREGLDEQDALLLAAQTAKGAAEMILQKQGTPQELIDAVTSPGGTTQQGLAVLEKRSVAEALAETMRAATKRAKELREKS